MLFTRYGLSGTAILDISQDLSVALNRHPVRKAEAVWEGDLLKGKGRVALGSGAFQGNYSFGSRFEEAKGTNPEELIGAAHAGCFSMAFSAILGNAGFAPKSIRTEARVHIDKVGDGFTITKIELVTVGQVPDGASLRIRVSRGELDAVARKR